MEMKNVLLSLLLSAFGIANIQCEDCFPGKSLEELEVMYNDQAQTMPEYQKLQIIRDIYSDKRKKLGKETTNCNIYREYPRLNYFVSATENNCKLAEQYEKEIFQIEELRKYAQDEVDKTMPLDLKSLRQCILKRKYGVVEIIT